MSLSRKAAFRAIAANSNYFPSGGNTTFTSAVVTVVGNVISVKNTGIFPLISPQLVFINSQTAASTIAINGASPLVVNPGASVPYPFPNLPAQATVDFSYVATGEDLVVNLRGANLLYPSSDTIIVNSGAYLSFFTSPNYNPQIIVDNFGDMDSSPVTFSFSITGGSGTLNVPALGIINNEIASGFPIIITPQFPPVVIKAASSGFFPYSLIATDGSQVTLTINGSNFVPFQGVLPPTLITTTASIQVAVDPVTNVNTIVITNSGSVPLVDPTLTFSTTSGGSSSQYTIGVPMIGVNNAVITNSNYYIAAFPDVPANTTVSYPYYISATTANNVTVTLNGINLSLDNVNVSLTGGAIPLTETSISAVYYVDHSGITGTGATGPTGDLFVISNTGLNPTDDVSLVFANTGTSNVIIQVGIAGNYNFTTYTIDGGTSATITLAPIDSGQSTSLQLYFESAGILQYTVFSDNTNIVTGTINSDYTVVSVASTFDTATSPYQGTFTFTNNFPGITPLGGVISLVTITGQPGTTITIDGTPYPPGIYMTNIPLPSFNSSTNQAIVNYQFSTVSSFSFEVVTTFDNAGSITTSFDFTYLTMSNNEATSSLVINNPSGLPVEGGILSVTNVIGQVSFNGTVVNNNSELALPGFTGLTTSLPYQLGPGGGCTVTVAYGSANQLTLPISTINTVVTGLVINTDATSGTITYTNGGSIATNPCPIYVKTNGNASFSINGAPLQYIANGNALSYSFPAIPANSSLSLTYSMTTPGTVIFFDVMFTNASPVSFTINGSTTVVQQYNIPSNNPNIDPQIQYLNLNPTVALGNATVTVSVVNGEIIFNGVTVTPQSPQNIILSQLQTNPYSYVITTGAIATISTSYNGVAPPTSVTVYGQVIVTQSVGLSNLHYLANVNTVQLSGTVSILPLYIPFGGSLVVNGVPITSSLVATPLNISFVGSIDIPYLASQGVVAAVNAVFTEVTVAPVVSSSRSLGSLVPLESPSPVITSSLVPFTGITLSSGVITAAASTPEIGIITPGISPPSPVVFFGMVYGSTLFSQQIAGGKISYANQTTNSSIASTIAGAIKNAKGEGYQFPNHPVTVIPALNPTLEVNVITGSATFAFADHKGNSLGSVIVNGFGSQAVPIPMDAFNKGTISFSPIPNAIVAIATGFSNAPIAGSQTVNPPTPGPAPGPVSY